MDIKSERVVERLMVLSVYQVAQQKEAGSFRGPGRIQRGTAEVRKC